jgi:hypothetical protein
MHLQLSPAHINIIQLAQHGFTGAQVEPQKGVPHCGSPVGPAGIPREREGVGLKILSAGRDSRKIPATPAL